MRKMNFRVLITTFALLSLLFCGAARAQVAHTSYFHITTDATFTVKPGAGVLTTVCLNGPVATQTISIFDGTAATGAAIAVITVPTSPQPVCLLYNVNFITSLTVVTAVTPSDITVGYQ
jgi:hypothetical protein